MKNKKNIIEYVNKIFQSVEPITYDEFNKKFEFKKDIDLNRLECIVTRDDKLSHISLVVSIIEHLTGERIAFEIDDNTKVIKGIQKIYKGIS